MRASMLLPGRGAGMDSWPGMQNDTAPHEDPWTATVWNVAQDCENLRMSRGSSGSPVVPRGSWFRVTAKSA
jgi:hypothetical protein